jgi:beta-N-acetylhexosaminidase
LRGPAQAVLLLIALIAVGAVIRGASHHARQGASSSSGGSAPKQSPSAPKGTAPVAPLAKMLGQMIVARYTGTTPSASVLSRIRKGQVGGVILFSDNFAGGVAAARVAIRELQHAAAAGRNPPLLVMTDQEGGAVKRVPGPPTLAPSQMTSPSIAYAQGQRAGQLLRSLGVNVDLAPVADVEGIPGSFLGTRSFGSSPSAVAKDACAFANGVASQRVIYTLKHFPGLGLATASTDNAPVSIDAPASTLRSDYAAYRRCGGGRLAMVMVSSAIYPRLTGGLPAVMSPATYGRELRVATSNSKVVTISDDLQAAALAGQRAPARHAIAAGLDLLLYAGTEQASAAAYSILLSEARSAVLKKTRIQAAYDAVLALKQRVARVPATSR